MVLSDVSVKRPVFAAVMSLLLVAFGLLSYSKLPLREYPDIAPPVVSITTDYRGASAQIVETEITQVIEDQVSGIEGIRSIESASDQGRSRITIEFDLSRDMDSAANDVRERVSRIARWLPEDADPPQVYKANTGGDVQIWIHLTADNYSEMALTDFAERNLVDTLSALDGVASIMTHGHRQAMRIWLDRVALAARGLTASDVEAALVSENVELPAGRVESSEREFAVRVVRSYRSAEDFARLVIARGADGHLVRLGEVAEVEVAAEEERDDFKSNGKRMVGIGVIKQSQANALEVSRAVNGVMDELRGRLKEGMELNINVDSSIFVEAALKEVYKTLGIAAILVILVIYLFLGTLRATAIPAVTVPVSLIASFLLMAALGYSVNLMTLLALVLAIGLVVDDSIVVLENIYRRVELGEPPLLAAYRGARQVSFAVVSTTMVLVAVFVPIMFLGGNIGRMFAELAAMIGAAVIFSAVVALSLTPMMCSKLIRRDTERRWLARHVDDLFAGLAAGYRRTLEACLPHPLWVGLGLLATVGLSVFLVRALPNEFTPLEDQGMFYIRFSTPEGSSLDATREKLKEIEEIVFPYLEKGYLHRVISRIPSFGTAEAVNSGQLTISMKPWDERDIDTEDLVAEINRQIRAIPGVRAFAIMPQGIGVRGYGPPLQFVIAGENYEDLAEWRDIVIAKASENPRLFGLVADYQETKPELVVSIDKDRAADLGVSVGAIARTLETMLNGRIVTSFPDRGEEYDVIVQGRDEDRRSPSDLTNIYVRSDTTRQLIPLSNLVSFVDRAGPGTLNRFNRSRAITISGSLAPGYSLGEALAFLETIVETELPPNARVDYKGESKELQESTGALYFSFGLALLVVFLVLAAQFESFVHPFVIILTVPLAVAGALVGLYLLDNSLNIYSQIGIVMLVGIAAKNGILIVEFANQLRDEGLAIKDALLEASAIRLRPILMTAISTMFGAVPLALAAGAGAASRVSLGIVVFSGVMFATLLTLFVIPVYYNILARYTGSPEEVARKLKVLEDRNAARPADQTRLPAE